MIDHSCKYIYGPVYSWRLGLSLGIDPISNSRKVCNLDCIYCQLGKTPEFETQRKEFVSTRDLLGEINAFPEARVDYLTFSGRGEPTLAKNLGEMIRALRQTREERIAVITNATLLDQDDVQKDLSGADCVLLKLDACSPRTFQRIDQSAPGINFWRMVGGIIKFRSLYKGKLALQIMLAEANQKYAGEIAAIAREIHPDEVQLNTPLRPSAVKPLSREEMERLKSHFKGLPVISVYDAERKESEPLDCAATIHRHGNF